MCAKIFMWKSMCMLTRVWSSTMALLGSVYVNMLRARFKKTNILYKIESVIQTCSFSLYAQKKILHNNIMYIRFNSPPSAYVSDPYPSWRPFAQVPSYFALLVALCRTPYRPLKPCVHSPLYSHRPRCSTPRPWRLPFCHCPSNELPL